MEWSDSSGYSSGLNVKRLVGIVFEYALVLFGLCLPLFERRDSFPDFI